MLAGRLEDGRRSCLSHMFEAVGAYKAGKLDEAGVEDYENNACPTCGSCSGMYTANSMNCLTEPSVWACGATAPSCVWSARLRLAKHAGMQIMELVAKNIRPPGHHDPRRLPQRRDSGHGPGLLHQHHAPPARHRPRVRHRAGSGSVQRDLLPNPPTCAILPPAGDTYMEDLEGAGGVYAVMKELTKKGLLDTSVLTCTGKTLAENLEGVVNPPTLS